MRFAVVAVATLLLSASAAFASDGQITGTARDASGSPLRSIDVYVSDHGSAVASSSTLADGSFAIAGVRPGSYWVSFSSPRGVQTGYVPQYYGGTRDWESAVSVVVGGGATTSGIDASLQRAGAISGRVTDAAGNPLHGLDARAIDPARATGDVLAITDADGRYTIGGLAPGVYQVAFQGYDPARPDDQTLVPESYDQKVLGARPDLVQVAAGETTSGIDGQLHPGGTISGTVTDTHGAPMPGASAQLDGTGQWANVDAGGHYTITDVEPGTYAVHFEQPPGTYNSDPFPGAPPPYFSASATVAAGATTTGVDEQLPRGGAITGTVTDAQGHPLANVTATLAFQHASFANSFGDMAPSGVRTDANGRYTLSGIAPESGLRVWFWGAGDVGHYYGGATAWAAATPITIADGETTAGIDTQMTPGATITGHVLDPQGQPVTNAFVEVYDLAGKPEGFAIPDATGAYTVPRLPAGSYAVEFEPHGALALQYYNAEASPGAADLVTLLPGATASGIDAHLSISALPPLGSLLPPSPTRPSPTPAAPALELPAAAQLELDRFTGQLAVSRTGTVRVSLRCTGPIACPGSASLSVNTAQAASRGQRRPSRLTIAATRFRVGESRAQSVTLRLSATGRSLLRHAHGRLAATIAVADSSRSAAATTALAHLRSSP